MLKRQIHPPLQAHTAVREYLFEIVEHLKIARCRLVLAVCDENNGVGCGQDKVSGPSIFLLARQRPKEKFHVQIVDGELLRLGVFEKTDRSSVVGNSFTSVSSRKERYLREVVLPAYPGP